MKAEDYFLTLIEDIKYEFGTEGGNFFNIFNRCNCFCCDKFGYHSAIVTHKPTGLKAKVLTKIMEISCPCKSYEFGMPPSKYCDCIEDPVDVAIKSLKFKIKHFCYMQNKEEKIMNKKDELAGRILVSTGSLSDRMAKFPDVMRENSKALSCEQIETIKQIKSIGNDFHAYLEILSAMETHINEQFIKIAQVRLEEVVMWAVKGISS